MEIRNRMADVKKLICNACQDFLKMVISPGWEKIVYQKAENEVNNNGRYKDKYIAAYSKMREVGFENYRIEDMDVTFIAELVMSCRNIIHIQEATRKALLNIKDDRNLEGHSNQNEPEEELYMRSLSALYNLKRFIETVDMKETLIDDSLRKAYRQKYSKKIEELKLIIDNERLDSIQIIKNMDKDIEKVLSCENQSWEWSKVSKMYRERYWDLEEDRHICFEYCVRVSDAGVIAAHSGAVDYFQLIRDYGEMERRMFIMYQAYELMPPIEVKHILYLINNYFDNTATITDGMRKIIDGLRKQGNKIIQTDEGYFQRVKQ